MKYINKKPDIVEYRKSGPNELDFIYSNNIPYLLLSNDIYYLRSNII